MTPTSPLRIVIDYDPEAQVWYVVDSELSGLNLEDADPGRLVTRLMCAASDLVELNMPGTVAGSVMLSPVFKSGIPVRI